MFKCYFQRCQATAGVLISVAVLMFLLHDSLPEETEILLFPVKVSQVFIHKHIRDGPQASRRVGTGRNVHFPLSKIFLEHTTDPCAWIEERTFLGGLVNVTANSQMLPMNDSG